MDLKKVIADVELAKEQARLQRDALETEEYNRELEQTKSSYAVITDMVLPSLEKARGQLAEINIQSEVKSHRLPPFAEFQTRLPAGNVILSFRAKDGLLSANQGLMAVGGAKTTFKPPFSPTIEAIEAVIEEFVKVNSKSF